MNDVEREQRLRDLEQNQSAIDARVKGIERQQSAAWREMRKLSQEVRQEYRTLRKEQQQDRDEILAAINANKIQWVHMSASAKAVAWIIGILITLGGTTAALAVAIKKLWP